MATRWRTSALRDLERIDIWLSSIEGSKPANTRDRIGEAIVKLERLGDIGRPGLRRGTRELLVQKVPYLIVYRMDGDDIDVMAIVHAAQQR